MFFTAPEGQFFILRCIMKNKKLINYITKVAIFSALSTVLYVWVKFPLPFLFPSFLDVQFSNLPAILAGLALGPLGGALVVIIRTLGKIAISGSGTMYVGDIKLVTNTGFSEP